MKTVEVRYSLQSGSESERRLPRLKTVSSWLMGRNKNDSTSKVSIQVIGRGDDDLYLI